MGFHVEHRQHKALNNRAENYHQPTRRRERMMKRFKSPHQAQRLLSIRDQVATANLSRASRERAFATWHEISTTSAIAESRTFEKRLLGSAVD